MNWGMQNRINRIIQSETGRCVMLAVDHGYFQGPTTGLRNISETITPLLPFTDALMITRGALRTWVSPDLAVAVILRMSGGASILQELSNETLTTSIEDAIRVHATAITCSVFIGGEYEKKSISNLAKLVNMGEKYGIPVLAVTAVGKDMTRDSRYLGLSSRICVETGAHMVKTYYCDGFEEVIEACGNVPVVIAGGKKQEEQAALTMAENAIRCGAVGVDMGRNIFQSSNPVGMIQAIRAVVHKGKSGSDAFESFVKS